MTTCLHPVILQSRPDGDMTTAFHSFFFLKFNKELNDLEVERRIPSGRARIEDLEIGLKMSLLSSVKKLDSEMCSSVVVSTSDGGRYYCTWRGFKWRIFVGVSKLAATSFTREIFMNLQQENPADLSDILLTLTETPIVPASGLKYILQFTNNKAIIDFSSIEQIRDPDLDMLAFRLFSPQMLVAVWEAVMLEKKMMIISRTESVVGPCCEFIRRLVLPLTVVSTFIPILPAEAAEMLESPVPYIVGVKRDIVVDTLYLNYPDTIVVDLDAGTVMEQRHMNYTGGTVDVRSHCFSGASAPSYLVNRLIESITKLMVPCLGRWSNRPCFGGNYNPDAATADTMCSKMDINESLHPLSSKSVSATVEAIATIFMETNLSLLSARSCNVRAFFRRPESRGLSTLQDRIASHRSVSSMGFDRRDGIICGCMQLLRERNDDDMLHFLPCWVEMDGSAVVVYEHADELPLLHILSKNVKSVSPSPMEPEGHVFELEVKNQSTFRFAATGPEARRSWIEILEAMVREAVCAGLVNGNGTASITSPYAPDAVDENVVASDIDNEAALQEKNLTEFRLHIMQTQMVSYIRFRVECDEYLPVLQDINGIRDIHTKLEGKSFERGLSKYLWTGNTVCNILSQIQQSAEIEEDLTAVKTELIETALKTAEIGSEVEASPEVAAPVTPTPLEGDAETNAKGNRSSIRCSVDDVPVDSNMSPFNAESVETKKKTGFFSFLSKGGKNNNNSPGAANGRSSNFFGDNEKKAQKLLKEKEREAEEARKTALRNLLHLVAASYRRCEAELSSKIVESRMQCQKALIENESAVCLNWMDAEHQQRNDAKSIVINITKVVKAYRKEDPSVENKGVLTKLISFKKNDKKKPAGVDVVPDDFSNYCLHCPTYWYVTAWEHVVRIPVVGMDRLMELVHEDRTRQEKEHMDRLAAEAEIRARNKADGGADVKPPEELDSDDESDDMEPDPTSSPRCNDSNTSISCDGVDDKCLLADLLNGGNKEVPSKFDIFGIRDSADYEDAVRVYWEEQVSAKKFGYVFMNPLETAMNSVSASPVPVRSDSRDSLNNDGEKSGSYGGSGRATSAHDKNALENAMAMALDQEKRLMRIEELVAIVARESDMIRGVREEQCKSRVQYIRKGLVKHVTNVLEETIKNNKGHLVPFLQSILGYTHYRLCNYDEALQRYSVGNFVNQKRVMYCIATKFLEIFVSDAQSNAGSEPGKSPSLSLSRKKHSSRTISSFLKWATNHGTIVGLQAYRILTELMHKRVAERLSDAVLDENTGLNKKKTISFPRVHMQSFARKRHNLKGGEDGTGNGTDMVVEEEGFRSGLNNGALSKARGGLGVDAPDFTYATPSADIKTDVLNEVVICVVSTMQPCELSIQLLTKLREILRAACEKRATPAELSQLKNINASNWFQMPIVPAMLTDIISSSAYRSFELQASQLQKVDLSSLNDNEKLLFFTNVYNITTVHGFIVKGLPGKNLYERTSFMRSSKYNIGGFVFSLVEIEHGILRAASSSPMLFGPFSASMAFSEKDNRLAFALKVPKPLVSFCLFTACGSSPPLVVLRDPQRVDDEMRRYSMSYMEKFVFIETHMITRAKTVWLPDLIRFYWKDFGGNRAKVLHNVMKLSNREMQAKLDAVINSSANVKPKVNFVSFDWSEMIVM